MLLPLEVHHEAQQRAARKSSGRGQGSGPRSTAAIIEYNKKLAAERKAAKAAKEAAEKAKAEAPAPVIIEEHHELPELVHADPLPTKKATKRTAKKAPAKKAEMKPTGPDMEELKNAFVKNYSRLYQTDDDHESGEFYDAVDKFDEMSANDPQFAATVQKFNKYMGDLISSDREAAAFVMALDNLEKAKTPEMVPTVQQLCCSINPKCASFPPPPNCATRWALADTRTIFCMTTAESTPFCTGTTKPRMKGAIRQSRTKPTKCQPCRTMCRTCCTVWTTTSIIFSMLISSNS